MLHDILRHLFDSRISADELFQCRPLGLLRFAERRVFFVLEYFLDFVIEFVDFYSVDIQFRQSAFVVDRNSRAVFDCVLNVVNADVIAEHGTCVLVVTLHRRTGEANKSGVGQCVA